MENKIRNILNDEIEIFHKILSDKIIPLFQIELNDLFIECPEIKSIKFDEDKYTIDSKNDDIEDLPASFDYIWDMWCDLLDSAPFYVERKGLFDDELTIYNKQYLH